jgi:tetratricopeptide (TPR) repeat protein
MGQKYKEGLEEFQKALTYSDRKAPVFYNIGLCYINMGDKDKAKEYFMKALEIDRKNPDFIAARYYIYGVKILVTSREKHVPGEVFGEILLNSEPVFEIQTSVGGFSPYERAAIIAGRLENMISAGLKPVEIEIGKMKNETVLQTAVGQLIMTVTKKVAEREGTTPEKLAKVKMETLKKILTSATSVSYSEGGFVLQGQSGPVKDMKGVSTESTYLHRGDAFYSDGKTDKAVEEYKKALEINPSFSPACFCLGIIYFEQKDYKNAISNFSNAIKYNDKHIDSYIWLGKSYKESGNVPEAKEIFNRALKIAPDNKEVKGYLEKL